MNLGQIRSLMREYLNEPQAVFWTDAQLKIHANTAMRKVHNTIKSISRYHFTTRATFPTVAGTEYYNLPTDCKDVKLLTRINSEGREIPLSFSPWPDPTAFVPSGMMDPNVGSDLEGPSFFWIVGRAIRLLPRPQAVVTLKLYYESRITDLSADGDTPTCDEDYHDMIAKWGALEAGIKDNKQQEALIGMYKVREQDMLQDTLHRVPSPPMEVESFLQE